MALKKTQNPNDLGVNKDLDFPELPSHNVNNIDKLRTLHVQDIPLESNYVSVATSLGTYGLIKEIRINLNEEKQKWEAWLIYDQHEAAF